MTFQFNDRDIKTKWLNKCKEEMDQHKENSEKERRKKVEEEQLYLKKIRTEFEEEKLRQNKKKKMLMREELDLYYQHKQNKQSDEQKTFEEKMNKDNVSLNLGYEERVEKMKDYNNKLADNVDKNMKGYLNYKSSSNYNNLPNTRDKYEEYINNNYKEKSHIRGSSNSGIKNEIANANANKQNYIYKDDNLYYREHDTEFLNKMSNYNHQQYKDLQKQVFNYNHSMMNNKQKTREHQIEEKRKTNDERLRELDALNYIENEERIVKDQRQKIYKTILDDQMKIMNGEGQGFEQDFYQQPRNLYPESISPIHNSTPMIKKKEINPNPYNNKRYELGGTILSHNTILNPVHNYKYNKYMYNSHDMDMINNRSSLQAVGSQIFR